MKLKGLTKLALSGVALAAVAATLGTSTYAWYISNDTATINGATGSTAAAVTDGSIYAATNAQKDAGVWKNTIDLVTGTDCVVPTNGLNPYTKATDDATDDYEAAEGVTLTATAGQFVDKKGAAVQTQTDAYVAIDFWLLSRGDAVTAQPTLQVTNATTLTDAIKQTVYAASNLPTGISNPTLGTTKFAIDAVFALRMDVTYTAQGEGAAAIAPETNLDLAAASGYTLKSGFSNGGDANLYYDANVAGVNLYGCAKTSNAGYSTSVAATNVALDAIALEADKPTHVEIKIWLEGTDAQCFDSACGQDFTFTFSFAKI